MYCKILPSRRRTHIAKKKVLKFDLLFIIAHLFFSNNELNSKKLEIQTLSLMKFFYRDSWQMVSCVLPDTLFH